jgi:fatty-acid desaturase
VGPKPLIAILFALSGFGQQAVLLWHDVRRVMGKNPPEWRSFCPDLMKEPLMRWLDAPFVMPALFSLQLAAAWAVGGWWGILWLWAMHVTLTNGSWSVNSVCHWPAFGAAPYDARDDSRDVWWIGILAHGEGYHNAHHRYPRSARHALEGGFDLSWLVIVALTKLGLASNPWLPKKYRAA